MDMIENITHEEINGISYKVRMIEAAKDGQAALSHFFHNYKNGVSKKFKKEAISLVKQVLEYKFPESTVNNSFAESALQYLLFQSHRDNAIFPAPENPSFTFIDLFAGIGGFRIAAQNLGGKCVFTSEWDEPAQNTYKRNFGELPFGDITKDSTKNFIPDRFDLLCAGFPCQPFSYAGLNRGFEDKTRGTLFFDVLQILEKHKPKMFLLENVKGLKSHEGGRTLAVIEESLQSIGYNIQWKILNSYHFGLPQYRERWYCVGFLDNVEFSFPSGSPTKPVLSSIIDERANEDPRLRLSPFEIERIKYHFASEDTRVEHDNSKYAPNTKKGKHGVFSFQKQDGSLRFHIGDRAKTQIQEAFYACSNTYAPTIIANRVPKLWDLQRRLSVLESQRLQGFPDKFEFPVSDNQAYKQLGNSVAIPVLTAIINNMLAALKIISK